MFSVFVLFILAVILVAGIFYGLGKLGAFEKVGNIVFNSKNMFKDKEKNEAKDAEGENK